MKGRNVPSVKYDTVLLIDEDQIDNFINERMITSSNFAVNVIVKNSAMSALSYIKQLLENSERMPKIIFLDLNMPIMDGFGFLDEYHQIATQFPLIKEQCKIIVLSSSISPTDIDRASMNPYVFKYLNKPLTEKYLDAMNI